MIHFTKEGAYKRIGLNIYRSRGGFVMGWVWYDVKTRELHGWRFRFRWHMKPRFIFERNRQSVIDNYLSMHDLIPLDRALLQDHAPHVYAVVQYAQEQERKRRLDAVARV